MNRLRSATQSNAIVQQHPHNAFGKTVIEKAPPSLKQLRAIARKTVTPVSSVASKSSNQSYSAAVTAQASASSTTTTSIIPPSPSQSLSTITTSQQSQQLVGLSQTTESVNSSSALALFRQETEKEFAEHEKTTLSSLQLFKNELIRANKSATQFRESLIEAQKATNNSMSILQESQQKANQRLQALESNMEFTVKGIEELLAQKKAIESSDLLKQQEEGP